ncbi:hypothetical protein NKG99_07215 [Mesorhizobium sp. M1409]
MLKKTRLADTFDPSRSTTSTGRSHAIALLNMAHKADGSFPGLAVAAPTGLIRRSLQVLRPGGQPDSHARLQPFGTAVWIKAQSEGIEIMVANGAGRAPGREFPQWSQFRHAGIYLTPILHRQRYRFAECHFVEIVFTQRESEPSVTIRFHCHNRLSRTNDLAGLGNADAYCAVRWGRQSGLVQLGLEIRDRRFGQRHVGIGQSTLLDGGTRAGFGNLRPLEIKVSLGLCKRGRAVVERLLAGEVLAGKRRCAVIPLLGEQKIGLRRLDGLGRDCHLFHPHTRIDPIPLCFGARSGGFGFTNGCCQLGIVKNGKKIALVDVLAWNDGYRR